MPEKLSETLITLSNFLRYLGKYDESNAVIWMAREIDRHGVQRVQDLDYVEVRRKEIK